MRGEGAAEWRRGRCGWVGGLGGGKVCWETDRTYTQEGATDVRNFNWASTVEAVCPLSLQALGKETAALEDEYKVGARGVG